MFRNLFNRKIPVNGLFTGHYVGVGPLYVALFNRIPNMVFIPELNTANVLSHIEDKYKRELLNLFQHNYFQHNDKQVYFNNTIFVLREKRMIELADSCVQILYKPKDFDWVNKVMRELVEFRTDPVPVKENRIIGFARQNDAN